MDIKDVESIYGLSPLQEELLLHAGTQGLDQCYRFLHGSFDITVFEHAWQQVLSAYPELRTTFVWKLLDKPVQLVHKQVKSEVEQEDSFESVLQAEQGRACDPSKPPLVRMLVCQMTDEVRQLILSYHPLLLDAQSAGRVVEEVINCYERLLNKQEAEAKRVRPFKDYINWLKEYDWSQSETFWRQLFESYTPSSLPLARSARAESSAAADYVAEQLHCSAETTERLRSFAREQQLTLEALLHGLWSVLLSRYSGEEDVLFGLRVSNRPAELELATSMIGPLTSTLPARVKVPAAACFATWLRQFQMQLNALRQHSHASLVQISEWAGMPVQSLAYETSIAVHDYLESSASHELNFAARPKSLLDIRVTLNSDIELQAFYARDLFEAETIRRMLGHYAQLLEAAAHNPLQPISALRLLTPGEEHRLLVEWNSTRSDYDQTASVITLFERQVEETPEAVAVVFAEERVSYRELNRRANRLGHYLRGCGVGPEVRVGLLVERSVEMVVALLGVLKAGGAYVPLDSALPAERIQFMLEDCQAPVLLTQERLLERLPACWAQVVCLDTDWPTIEYESEDNPGVEVSAGNLAYIIYTSGSTGSPKGVLVEHQALSNRIQGMRDLYRLEEGDCHLQFVPFSFDVAVEEILVTLTSGAAIVQHLNHAELSPHELLLESVRAGVTKWNMTASYWHTLVDAISKSEQLVPESLRWLVVGGEIPSVEKARAFARLVRHPMRVINAYGPTEALIMSTYFEIPLVSETLTSISRIPIGRPVANTRVYILNAQLHPAPVGVAGELFIGGICVARGYLNRPELTAERFIPDPYSGEAGARLYRTGDLARYLPDGELEFLGRVDSQVKVRGYRIELGEIEAALLRHAEVRECVVAAREDEGGGKRLVAYVVGRGGAEVEPAALREHLRRSLPEYMVPAQFVTLESLPLTPNGKVDRKALPAPEQTRTLGEGYEAPQTAVEEMLAGIWGELLGVRAVGRNDNFFDLGGDSILSIQLVARAAEAGLRLSPKLVFRHQTLAALAAVADEASPALAAEQGEVSGEVPLTPIQRWFFEQGLKSPHHYNQAVLLRPRRALNAELLRQALVAVVRHHDGLRLRYWQDGEGRWRQEHVRAAAVEGEELLRVVQVGAEERAGRVQHESERVQQGFSLSAGMLVRAVLFEGWESPEGNGGGAPWQRLLVVMHHLVTDGVTWRVVIADWQRAYEQLERGARVQLPAKTSSYQRWAERMVGSAAAVAEQEGEYWVERARVRAGRLPRDLEGGGGNVQGSTGYVERVLSAAETEVLLREVPRGAGAGIEEVLVAAVVAAVWNWAGGEAVRVEVEGHGRDGLWGERRESEGAESGGYGNEECGVERTAGWFTAAYPLVIEAGTGSAAALEWVRRVRAAKAGVPGGGEGYGLVRYVSEEVAARALRTAAGGEAEVSFNYLGQFDQSFAEDSLFEMASESSGAAQAADQQRSHLIQVTAVVADKQFRVDWSYSKNVHLASTVERLADTAIEFLRTLITHSTSRATHAFDRGQIERQLGTGARVDDVYSLTQMQRGILFQSLYAAHSEMYFNQISCTLRGELDVEAFHRAWQQVVDRHSVLRTSFVWDGVDEEMQVVSSDIEIPWEEEDWSSVSADDLSERLEAFLVAQRRRGFRLSQPPLLRFALLRLGAREHRFVWCWHHLLLDGWSLPLLFSEVFALYAGTSTDALGWRRPYRDFVAWLRARERGGARAAAEAYWREALRGFSAPTSLRALERRGGDKAGVRQAEVMAQLDERTTAALTRAARQRGLTLNATVQGAWGLTLMRVSGVEDVVFGAVVSGRGGGLEGIERMVGLFINTLAVRVRVSRWSEGAWEWLRRLQDEQVEAREHEQVGLVEVAGWSEVERGVGLFETLLAFENYPVDESVQEMRLAFEIEEIKTSIPVNYPLTMTVVPGPDMVLRLAYDAGRFDELAVNELLAEFRAALRCLATHEDVELGELNNLLNDEKRERRSAAEQDLKQMRGLKFRTVRRASVITESAQVAKVIAED